ncbi:hypothetical protein J34TS1_32080 [Paenibacillus azoreducens]|uniref:Uncharacterized protein n=1 Tax=Paenibacillus azoreducens TaxID=116718 RepID=A0A919YF00_9BACL|nr:hypothetical protein J34TS1_32080 [Paenibacillus azoreducens]
MKWENSNPSAETLISIRVRYNVNLNWLLTGNATEAGATYEDNREEQMLKGYRSLNDKDKIEIIEIIQLKNRLKSTV